MAIKTTSLVTLAAARAYCGLGVSENDWDTVLEGLIDGVSDGFSAASNRAFAKTTYTSLKLNGPRNSPDLCLPNFPAISIASIYESDILLVEDEDYYVNYAAGIVRRIGGNWIQGWHTIVITYTAGYVVQDGTPGTGETALPSDLRLAALKQIAEEWKTHKNQTWGESSRSFPDGSVSRQETTQFLREVKQVLDRYKRFCGT